MAALPALIAFFPACAADSLQGMYADPLGTLRFVPAAIVNLLNQGSVLQCQGLPQEDKQQNLPELVDMGLCHNAQIRYSWLNIRIAAAQLGEARAAYLPTAGLTGTPESTRTLYASGSMEPNSKIFGTAINGSVSWRLFDFGGRDANADAANQVLLAAMSAHDAKIQELMAEITQGYFDLLTAKATLYSKTEIESLAKATLESARHRSDRGIASPSDVLQSTTAVAKASLETLRAQGDYRKAMATLCYLVGLPPDFEIHLSDDDQDLRGLEEKDLTAWFKMAAEAHPAILSAQAQWQSAKRHVAAAKSEGSPTVDFVYNYYQNGYPNQGLNAVNTKVSTIGLNITIPLFDGFGHKYRVGEAQARADQLEAQLQDTQQDVLTNVVKTYADTVSSLQSLQASATLVTAAQESAASSRRRYEKGAADILEVLATQAAFEDAAMQKIRSVADWRSSRLHLLASVGVLNGDAFRSDGNTRQAQ